MPASVHERLIESYDASGDLGFRLADAGSPHAAEGKAESRDGQHVTAAPANWTRHVALQVVVDPTHQSVEVTLRKAPGEELRIVLFGVLAGQPTHKGAACRRNYHFVSSRSRHPTAEHTTTAHIYY